MTAGSSGAGWVAGAPGVVGAAAEDGAAGAVDGDSMAAAAGLGLRLGSRPAGASVAFAATFRLAEASCTDRSELRRPGCEVGTVLWNAPPMCTGAGVPTSRLRPRSAGPSTNQLQARSISPHAAIVPTRGRAPVRYSEVFTEGAAAIAGFP